MATQYRPNPIDPLFFTQARIDALTKTIQDELRSINPTYVSDLMPNDVVNMMYKVWRPHVSYKYMENMVVHILVHEIVSQNEQAKYNQMALDHHTKSHLAYDTNMVLGSLYKLRSGALASRPEISLSY